MSLFNVVNDQAQFDAASPVSSDVHGAGIRFTQAGAARVTTTAGTFFNQGIPMSASGQVAIVDATAGLPADTTYLNGLPISGNKVCVSRNARSVVSNGLPFDSNGAIAGAINFDLNFIGTDTLDPQVTFTRASSATFTGSNGLIQTATTNTPRFDYNLTTLAANGLLIEEQRTNLLTYSSDFSATWNFNGATRTANATTAPDGTNNAVLLTALGNTGTVSLSAIVVNATSVTYTVYVKRGNADLPTNFRSFGLYNNTTAADLAYANVNYATGAVTLSGPQAAGATAISQTLPNGWFRIGVTITTGITSGNSVNAYLGALGSLNVAGDTFYCWGAQLEAGSFATSYIPTVASQVTRSADVASVNTLSPWYNATEGTLYAEFSTNSLVPAGLNTRIIEFNDGTASNNVLLFADPPTGNSLRLRVRAAGIDQALLLVSSVYATNTTIKTAAALKANDFAFSVNASTPSTDTSGTLPTFSELNLAAVRTATNNAERLNGHLRRITYYPRRLSNAELQAITA